jgi:hypothetical protein
MLQSFIGRALTVVIAIRIVGISRGWRLWHSRMHFGPNTANPLSFASLSAEMVHFNSDAIGLGPLFAKLEPVVKAYARDQTRKPVDVSLRLNAEGYTTAAGAAWTPRLVHFLLALMFNNPKADSKRDIRPARPTTPSPSKAAPSRTPRISMDDKDQIARMLSSLGRVTVRP